MIHFSSTFDRRRWILVWQTPTTQRSRYWRRVEMRHVWICPRLSMEENEGGGGNWSRIWNQGRVNRRRIVDSLQWRLYYLLYRRYLFYTDFCTRRSVYALSLDDSVFMLRPKEVCWAALAAVYDFPYFRWIWLPVIFDSHLPVTHVWN